MDELSKPILKEKRQYGIVEEVSVKLGVIAGSYQNVFFLVKTK